MIGLLCFALAVLASPLKSKLRLEAENAALRHQLIVLRRKLRGRVRLANSDRWFFVQLYRWFPSILQVGRPAPLDHVFGNARLRHIKPKLEQFAMDTWRAPKRIFDAHLPDQRAQSRLDLRPPPQDRDFQRQ